MSELNHNELAEKAKDDEAAFTQLYQIYINQIYGYIFKRLGHREDTQDIVSDIFRKVFLHLKKFNPQKASFRTWIYKIATNTLIDFLRTQRNPNKPRHVDIEIGTQIADDHPTANELVLSKEQQGYIRACLKKLPAKYQKVVQLKFFADFSNQEIAQVLKLQPNHVGVLLYRALKKLKEIII